MYSPGNKKQVANGKLRYELEGIPSIEGKERVRNANVYLEPIYPKSRVSYQNYQRHRVLYTKKIHQEKIAYDIEKEKRVLIEPLRTKKRKSNPKFNKHIVTLNKIKESEASLEPKLIINHIQAVDKKDEKEPSCEM